MLLVQTVRVLDVFVYPGGGKKRKCVATEIFSFARGTCSHVAQRQNDYNAVRRFICTFGVTFFRTVGSTMWPFLFSLLHTWKCNAPHVLVYSGHIRRQQCLCLCVSGRAVFVLGRAPFLWCVWARLCPACVDPAPCLCGSTAALRQKRKLCFNSISRALPSTSGPLC